MKIGFLFAGQGSQKVGMGKDLYEKYPTIRAVYDNLDLDFDIKKVCFDGPKEVLDDTAYTQSCVVATSLGIASVLKEEGIIPDYVAGLSLGEYSALSFAGAMTIKDACSIVRKRGQIMAEALPEGTTKMVAIMATPEETILEVCQEVSNIGVCEIANYNCPGQIVITGENAAVDKAVELLLERGTRRAIPVKVSGAFHSSLLEDASKQLKEVLLKYEIKTPEILVVYNVTGKTEQQPVVDLLTQQIKSSVRFMQSVNFMLEQGVETFVEIGPGSSLTAFMRRINKDIPIYNVEDVASMEKVLGVLKQNG